MEGETGLSQLTHLKIHASLRTSKLQCWRPSPVQCMTDDEDVAGGQNQNLRNMMQHAKNYQKHINMLGMEVPCSIPTLRTYFPSRCLDPAFLQFGIMTPRGPSDHPLV